MGGNPPPAATTINAKSTVPTTQCAEKLLVGNLRKRLWIF